MFRAGKKDTRAENVAAVVVAAGSSLRMQGVDKQFADLCGLPVLVRSILALQQVSAVLEIIVVVKEENIPLLHQMLPVFDLYKVKTIVGGGQTRQESVYRGFCEISPQAQYILIHDGARPLVMPQDIESCIEAAQEADGAALAVAVYDTVKRTDANNNIIKTVDRNDLWLVQTPQIFKVPAYRRALEKAKENGQNYTDDCQLLEAAGLAVQIVPGQQSNIKITTVEDLYQAQAYLAMLEGEI